MTGYLLRRALHALLVLLIVTLAAFLLIHAVPGDPVRIMLGAHAPPDAVQRVRHQLGLDQSVVHQFGSFLAGLPRGDLGTSINLQAPVRDIIGPRIWPSVFLLAYGTLISVLLAVPLGVLSALHRNRPADHGIRVVATVGLAMPSFWFALLLVEVFSLHLGWLPVSGYGDGFVGHLESLTLPAITVAFYLAPLIIRTLRSSLIETLAVGLRHLRPRARLCGVARRRQARAPQLADRDDHDPRDQHRLPDQLDGRDRERVRDPRPRLAARLVDPGARLPHHLGADADLRGAGHPGEPRRRPLVRDRRPEDPALMAVDAARARTGRENEKLRMLRALERRARSERRWATLSLWIGVAIVGLLALAALLAPVLFPGGPNNQDLLNTLQPPSWQHPFGTDNLGRDIFARTIYAARIDLTVGLITTYVPLVLGVLLGLLAGFRGGWLETVVMRAVDVVVAFPFIVLVLAVVAIVGPGLLGVYIGITVVGWALYARLTRAEVLVLKDHQFVLAATSLGFSRRRVMFRHVLPNVIRPNLVFSTLDIVLNILVLASLSFLGLGVQPPAAEWGLMVAEGQTFLLTAWWISTLPGVVIVIAGVGFSLVGDGLADRLGRGRRGRVGENEGMILARRRGGRVTP